MTGLLNLRKVLESVVNGFYDGTTTLKLPVGAGHRLTFHGPEKFGDQVPRRDEPVLVQQPSRNEALVAE